MNPHNMNDYNEGDLVEAVRGETIIRGRVKTTTDDKLWLGSSDRTISGLISQGGFTITVIEKAPKNPLPTEPGLYVTDTSDPGGVFVLYRLNSHGQWFVMWTMAEAEQRTESAMIAGTNGEKLFRLEPAHETAKKVLSRVATGLPMTPLYLHDSVVKIVAMVGVEFGVGGNE